MDDYDAHERKCLVDNNVQVVDTSVGKVLLEKLSLRILVSLHDGGTRRPISVRPTTVGFLVGDVEYPDSTVEQAIEGAARRLVADRDKRQVTEELTKPWATKLDEYWGD